MKPNGSELCALGKESEAGVRLLVTSGHGKLDKASGKRISTAGKFFGWVYKNHFS